MRDGEVSVCTLAATDGTATREMVANIVGLAYYGGLAAAAIGNVCYVSRRGRDYYCRQVRARRLIGIERLEVWSLNAPPISPLSPALRSTPGTWRILATRSTLNGITQAS